jgi:DNA-binding transcriptional regulator YiaG
MTALMPCPFCGSCNTEVEGGDAPFNVRCHNCGALGHRRDYRFMAVEAWNTRHTPSPSAPASNGGVRMTPAEIRAIVDALPITAAQLDAVMGVSPGSVSRWQLGTVTPTAPVLRLFEAYQAGYRPPNWPHKGET